MKYSAAIAVIVAAGAYADLRTVQDVLTDVAGNIDSLNTAAQGFGGNVDAVKSKADSLIASLKKGKTAVDSSSDLSLQDAIGLAGPVQSLTKKGQDLADGFKARRSDVEKANACDAVRGELDDINVNSDALINSVVSKVPKDGQTIAQSLAAGLTKVLAQAQEDFSETGCKNSGMTTTGAEASMTSASSTSETAPTTAAETSSETETGTVMTPTVAMPTSIAGNMTGTGVMPPVTVAPITAGAPFLAPAGVLAMAVAAALL